MCRHSARSADMCNYSHSLTEPEQPPVALVMPVPALVHVDWHSLLSAYLMNPRLWLSASSVNSRVDIPYLRRRATTAGHRSVMCVKCTCPTIFATRFRAMLPYQERSSSKDFSVQKSRVQSSCCSNSDPSFFYAGNLADSRTAII